MRKSQVSERDSYSFSRDRFFGASCGCRVSCTWTSPQLRILDLTSAKSNESWNQSGAFSVRNNWTAGTIKLLVE